ncbi:hypothetical protein Bca52824_091394 [Brassica carinata]|uniref:Uncharacterized protein n=1 Tax=Brassica carinata TaxID=52824 RepID=A0A8X7NWV4_BRACI|nr:hypothetical protein Bca52824_091394 [Brassica carinata]
MEDWLYLAHHMRITLMMMRRRRRNLLLDTDQYVLHLDLWPNLILIVPGAGVLKEIIKRTMAIGFLLRRRGDGDVVRIGGFSLRYPPRSSPIPDFSSHLVDF